MSWLERLTGGFKKTADRLGENLSGLVKEQALDAATLDEFLAVIGGRAQFEHGPHSIDLVWVPTFTPSRTPLILIWLPLGWVSTPGRLSRACAR